MPRELEWTPDRVRRFWNEISAGPLAGIGFAAVAGTQLLSLVAPWIPRGGRALDYGAGAGQFTRLLLQAGYGVGVFEPADMGLPADLRADPRVEVLTAADLDDPSAALHDRGFDLVFCLETIEHVLPEEWDAFGARLHALLRPGGTLVVSTPHAENLEMAKVHCVECDHRFHPWQHVRSFTAAGLDQALAGMGFRRRKLGAADFSGTAALYDEILSLRRQLADVLRIVRGAPLGEGPTMEALQTVANSTWQAHRAELQEDLRRIVRPVVNELTDALRMYGEVRYGKLHESTRDMQAAADLLSNHLNELRRQLSVHASDQAFPLGNVASFSRLAGQIVADLVQRSIEGEMATSGRREVRESARAALQAQADGLERLSGELMSRVDRLIERMDAARLVLPEYSEAETRPADDVLSALDEPVGRLSQLDDAQLLETVRRAYVELRSRRGLLQWAAPDRSKDDIDFLHGAGQTLVYVGERPA